MTLSFRHEIIILKLVNFSFKSENQSVNVQSTPTDCHPHDDFEVLVLLFNSLIACDSNALPSVLSANLLLWGYFIFALKMLICQTHNLRLGEMSEQVLNRPMAM